LKATGIKLLKLKYGKLLSTFAFNFKLRRYILELLLGPVQHLLGQELGRTL
jgi:hypothetical protein